MMFYVNQTYICDSQNVLGCGSYGTVYLGYKMCNGEPVAIKVFNKINSRKNHSQEFEILKSIEHENVVRLISIEGHPQLGTCLVMEACLEGSLAKVLENPKNLYGLPEDEFLLLLIDVTQGMKYLRSKNVIHRDIKPGNILRSRNSEGRYIYKLTDFDAARFLEEGESFSSIYGTEEYLNPDMYTCFFSRTSGNRKFTVTVDLWSIGVTFYHAATGNIPFKAFLGRKDRNTTLKILSSKPEGVISGTQVKQDGLIVWEEDLPKSCQLNVEFRSMITSLLRGLLERNSHLSWNFDQFFHKVDEIVSHRKIVVFYVNRLKFLVICLKPEQNYTDLQEALTKQTGVAADDQLLVSKYNLRTKNDAEVQDFSSYTKSDPLIFFDKKNTECQDGELSFLNIIQSPENENIKQLVANEYVNESQIKDLSIINSLCETVKKLFSNITLQQQKESKLKIDYLIKSKFKLIQSIQNFAEMIQNDGNIEIKTELKNLEKLKAETIISLENLISKTTTLQDNDNIIRSIEISTRKVDTLSTKIRMHRNLILKNSNIDYKTLCGIYLIEMAKDLTQLYSCCETEFKSLAIHMKTWCENTALIFLQNDVLRERIKTWEYCNEKLANMFIYVGKRGVHFDQHLQRLGNISKETSDLMVSQSSVIQEMEQVIAALNKVCDVITEFNIYSDS